MIKNTLHSITKQNLLSYEIRINKMHISFLI
jgi:hypothetical protein